MINLIIFIIGSLLIYVFCYFIHRIWINYLISKLNKAYKHYDANQIADSIAVATKLIKSGIAPFAFELLGDCHLKSENMTEAVKCYKQAIVLNKEAVYSYIGIGEILLTNLQYNDAIEYFIKALEFDTNNITARSYLAISYAYNGDNDLFEKEYNILKQNRNDSLLIEKAKIVSEIDNIEKIKLLNLMLNELKLYRARDHNH